MSGSDGVVDSEELNDLGYLEGVAEELEPESGGTADETGVDSEELPTDQVLIMAMSPLFDVLAPNWSVSTEEKQALAGAYAPVIDKYFGGVSVGVELQAVIVTVMIFAPRLSVPRVAVQEEDKKERVLSE